MQIPHIRHKLDIYRHKVIVLLVLLVLALPTHAQNNPTDNLPDYDDHKLHYGFLIGLHSSKYRVQYDDIYATPQFDTLHSVIPGNLGGFKLGFVINFHLLDYLDFRVLPMVAFYESDLTYRYTNLTVQRHVKDATIVEIPLLLKYKSQRRGNYAMYMIGGIKPSFEAVGRGEKEDSSDKLDLKKSQISIEIGAGFDMYFQLFKFSPEIRYSYGLKNMLEEGSTSQFNAPLKKLTTHNITLYISFEGGPSTISGSQGRRSKSKSGGPRRNKKVKI
ncbi:MAG: PorT family protein [Cytophagales bacterium]|nr:PorT family protein [Cytophagales bacterium]